MLDGNKQVVGQGTTRIDAIAIDAIADIFTIFSNSGLDSNCPYSE